ncbi:MAG: hypothetical protein QF502_07910 [Nitrospinaceae bacterium]|jgi:hypothetical protein|nr:hypothetical protein [Nitrospinaceae bacterium]MDP6657173.1 hypothetical protein [Nitrospinaceae bacterium]MDP7057631.1 hypothetical protein [Nitrospinaceae bacterium]|tara:strand:+ start:749 stop:925 length:177 start_codon:yes stop_codon:yes gene_type:complete
MNPFAYYLGRSLQLLGLATITLVVLLFFGQWKMEPLLYLTIAGAVEFYGGTWLLNRKQ